jgi:hypothetical protein
MKLACSLSTTPGQKKCHIPISVTPGASALSPQHLVGGEAALVVVGLNSPPRGLT